jgi:hypothetical protein
MMTFNHTVNLVTEIDEQLMPAHLLKALVSLDEVTLNKMFATVFAQAITEIGALDEINDNNTYAVVKFGAIK